MCKSLSLQREHPLFRALLLLLAAASWGMLIWQFSMMNNMDMCKLQQQEGS